MYRLRLLRVHDISDECIQKVSVLLSWPGWCMLVQLGRASAPQVTSTNWTDLLIDTNISVTALRPLHVSRNSLIKQTNLLFQTVTSDSHHVLNHRLPAIKHQRYKLKPRTYSFTLTCKSSFHDNCNLIIRTLFRDAYWLLWTLLCSLTVFIYTLVWYCSMWCVIVPLNHYDDDDVRRLRHQWGHLCHACQQHHYLLMNVESLK